MALQAGARQRRLWGEHRARRLHQKGLALKIGRLDEIAVDDSNAADAGTDQQAGRRRANGSAANYYGAGGEEALLALEAECRQKVSAWSIFPEEIVHDFSGPGGFRERARICDDSAKHDRTGNAAVLRFV